MKELYLQDSPICYYIDDSANKPWIVFIYAAFVDHNMFNMQLSHFAGKYNLLAIDLLGHGNSTHVKRGDTIEKMSLWIDQIFKVQGITAAYFVGVSLGSVFAQDFANKYPEKVLSLACFGGYNINSFDPSLQKSNFKQQFKMMLKAMFSIKWFAKAHKKISAYTDTAQEEFYKLNLKFKRKSFKYLANLKSLVNKYPNTKTPYKLLVGCGEYDIPAELQIVNDWAKTANCRKAIIKNAGHCVNMDNPAEFNKILEEFWEK